MKPKTVLEDHIETADDLSVICHYIDKVTNRLQSHYGKTSTLMKDINKLQPLLMGGIFSSIFGELDNDYNDVVDQEQYIGLGILYGNFPDRYEAIIARTNNGFIPAVEESNR
jgi:hypothetical protein